MVESSSDRRAEYHIRPRKVSPRSIVIRPANDGSFNATAVMGQMGFTRENGRGAICVTIQSIGKTAASINLRSGVSAVRSAKLAAAAADSSMSGASKYTVCWTKMPSVKGVAAAAANRMIRRENASGNGELQGG